LSILLEIKLSNDFPNHPTVQTIGISLLFLRR